MFYLEMAKIFEFRKLQFVKWIYLSIAYTEKIFDEWKKRC